MDIIDISESFHFYKPFISSVFYDKVTFDVDYGFS